MEFPFHKQEKDYTCGAASMRMALESLGIKKSEAEIVGLLGTDNKRGTWQKNFSEVADKFNLKHFSKENTSIEDIEKAQEEGFVVIACYLIPEENVDHYSVVKKIDSKSIHFWDPWFGPEHKYSLDNFMKVWKSDLKFEKSKRWIFGVKN